MKMVDVVRALRVGWYGNKTEFLECHLKYKHPIDCNKLWQTSLKYAGTIYVPIFDGINGTIGNLSVDDNHTDESHTLPIDTLVLNLAKNDEVDDNIGDVEYV